MGFIPAANRTIKTMKCAIRDCLICCCVTLYMLLSPALQLSIWPMPEPNNSDMQVWYFLDSGAFCGCGYYATLIGNPMLEVKSTVKQGCTKPSLVLLQKHLLGGCTIDLPLTDYHWWGHITSLCSTLLFIYFTCCIVVLGLLPSCEASL